jgi:hypothetical protein
METTTSLIASAIAILMAIGGIFTAIATRRKTAAEASEVITDSAMKLLAPLNKRIVALERQTAEQEKEIQELKRGVCILIAQLRRKNIKPEWTLKPEEV